MEQAKGNDMNEAEAFEAWCEREYGFTTGLMQDEARSGWQAACEWMRGQGEAIGWRVAFTKAPRGNFQEGKPDQSTVEYWRQQGVDFEYCYASPPTAQINEQMRDALQCLLASVQNCHCENSGAAQELAHAALAAATPK